VSTLRVAAAFAVALSVTPSFAQSARPPVEAFGTIPTLRGPSLSPDGKHLAMIQAYQGRPVATVWALDGSNAMPVVIPFDNGFISSVSWANDHRLLVTININANMWGWGVNPWYRMVAVDADGQNPVAMFSNIQDDHLVNGSTATVDDFAPDDPDHIYMPLWADYGVLQGRPDVRNRIWRVDVASGRAHLEVNGGPHTMEFFMDGTGKVVARRDQTNDPLMDHILAYESGDSWREIAKTDASNDHGYSVAGLSQDGKSLILLQKTGDMRRAGLIAMSLADGSERNFYFHDIYDADGALTDPWTGRVVGASYTSHLGESVYFDPKLKEIQSHLEAAFPGTTVRAVSWNRDRSRVVISTTGPTSPREYWLYDVQADKLARLGRSYGQLKPTDLGEVEVFDYKARDGVAIPAYLTLPPGKTPKNLPVVVLPHGGPMARDDMNFDWESQFLANRGYAVLRPNFRGSSGYGTQFAEAGYGQWGLKMQDDITDGVKKLIADGIADPKRICIVGGSYGGYAALAGAAFTPDLYACAAAWAPVTDLRELLYSEKLEAGGDDTWLASVERLYIGDRRKDAKKLDDASPALHADKIKIPVLLMHGEADATVRIAQSEEMERALQKAGKKVTFIRIPNETHQQLASQTRIRWLTELEKFLKANIGD